MALNIHIRPQAKYDIESIIDWLKQENTTIVKPFLQQLQTTFDTLADFPEIGHLRRYNNPALKNIRMFPVKNYSTYLIFYQTSPADIQIIRVLHGARDIARLFEQDDDH